MFAYVVSPFYIRKGELNCEEKNVSRQFLNDRDVLISLMLSVISRIAE